MASPFPRLVSAALMPAQLEPYKKLVGVLVRQTCVSVAISNPYLNLAEPLGAVMLRGDRLPGRSFTRLLTSEQEQLAGFVLAFEVPDDILLLQQQQQLQQQQHPLQGLHVDVPVITQQQHAAAAQVQAALDLMKPGLLGGWFGPWSASTAGASCRILPPAGPSAAAGTGMKNPEAGMISGASGAAAFSQGGAASAGTPSDRRGRLTGVLQAGSGHQQQQQQQQQQPMCSLGQQFLQSYLDSLGSLNTFG